MQISKNRAQRIIFNIMLVLSTIYLPWWITLPMTLCGLFLFDRFYEYFLVGILMDTLYGVPLEKFYGIWFVFTLILSIAYVTIGKLKRSIRFYDNV